MNFSYNEASIEQLEKIWDKNIANNPGNNRWIYWRERVISDKISGKLSAFIVSLDGDPIGEGTLIYSPDCEDIQQREELADNASVANVSALRILKEYEGKGHISRLMKEIESFAIEKGFSLLTIGVEAKETRNLGIYLHWGFDEFVSSEVEDGELVLYYRKHIR